MSTPESTTPVACTLSSHDLARRRRHWHELAATAFVRRIETASGLRLAFAGGAGVAEQLSRLLEVERDCCAWADWELDRSGDTLVVDVRSTGTGVAALHCMFRSL